MIGKKKPDELLDDLESIRDLLEEDDELTEIEGSSPAPAEDAEPDEDTAQNVPMLDDVVQGALELDEAPMEEAPLTQIGELSEEESEHILDDDTITALMGDSWKESADHILAGARSTILAAADDWSPQQTDELARALEVRIDAAVRRWLGARLSAQLAGLRAELLAVLRDTTDEFVAGLKASTDDKDKHG